MVKNRRAWAKFERELARKEKPDYKANLKIFEELYRYAKSIKAFPPENPLDGIEVDIRIARILNSVK